LLIADAPPERGNTLGNSRLPNSPAFPLQGRKIPLQGLKNSAVPELFPIVSKPLKYSGLCMHRQGEFHP
jgi:hypothetical protein